MKMISTWLQSSGFVTPAPRLRLRSCLAKKTVLLLFFLLQTPIFAQPREIPAERRGIHQIDLEKYKDFREKEPLPEFPGKPRPLIPRESPPSREVFGYLPYWVYSSYPTLNYDLLTTIAYFGANVNGFGNITNRHNWPAAALIDKAHSEGVRVVLTAILFDPVALEGLLSSPANRTNLINNLLTEVQNAGADGVTIDFEGVPSGQKANMTAFMTELSQTFHNAIPGSFVTIFSPAVDWSNVYDYNAIAQVCDGMVMQGYDYHWSSAPTAGPVAPLTGSRWGFANVTWTVNDYLSKTNGNVEKLILSAPYYGFEWKTDGDGLESPTQGSGTAIFYSTAYPNAMQYGRLWDTESQTPWYKYNDGAWHQGWYDDSLSLAKKYELINQLNLKGTAIWALSYDGERLELQGALADAFGSTAPPLKPTDFRVVNIGGGQVQIAAKSPGGATSYRIYRGTDGVNFDAGTDFPNAVSTFSNLSPDSTYYFKLSAVNGNGESNITEVLGVRPTTENVPILIVNGFDRITGTVNTFDFIKRFAPAVVNAGFSFDACANEAVQDGFISLLDYDAVLWISGEEGTANESFGNAEQLLIAEYLENGGKLFVSGSEIGFDLVERGNGGDKIFYQKFLKAEYIRDKVNSHAISGTAAGIFAAISGATFDDGSHGTYNVDFPDGIKPLGGSVQNMTYDGFDANTFGGAGIQYAGTFGNGGIAGKLIYLGIPFETLYPASTRDAVMSAILTFFDLNITGIEPDDTEFSTPDNFTLEQNYPNPFNPSTVIPYAIPSNKTVVVKLEIFNLLGQKVRTLIRQTQTSGAYSATWNGRDDSGNPVASGVYYYRLIAGEFVAAKKLMLLR